MGEGVPSAAVGLDGWGPVRPPGVRQLHEPPAHQDGPLPLPVHWGALEEQAAERVYEPVPVGRKPVPVVRLRNLKSKFKKKEIGLWAVASVKDMDSASVMCTVTSLMGRSATSLIDHVTSFMNTVWFSKRISFTRSWFDIQYLYIILESPKSDNSNSTPRENKNFSKC